MEENSPEEKGKAIKEDPEVAESAATNDNASASDNAEAKLAELEKEHLYLRAELENVKRQNFKERAQLLKFGGERLGRDLLDVIDVFKSALKTPVTAENFQDFVKGIEMTGQSLVGILDKHGIKEIECLGQAFDPNTQESLGSEPNETLPEGHVTQVFKSPYMYYDKLLRPGQVIVSRGKTE